MSGIKTIDDIKQRCVVDEESGCWIWGGGRTSGGVCAVWVPAIGRSTTIGVALCIIKTGKKPKRGAVWHSTCGRTDCANPDHRRNGTRSSQMLSAKLERSPLTRARIAEGMRKISKISDAEAEEIRSSSGTEVELAKKYGISAAHVGRIRRGEFRMPLASPGSSVFSWRPA